MMNRQSVGSVSAARKSQSGGRATLSRAILEMLEDRRLLSGQSPVAVDDTYNTPEDTPLVVAAPGVLGNDTDLENDTLTATVIVSPLHGALTLATDGSFTYTPAADYNGPDSFSYKVNDGTSDGNIAAVSITVDAVNDTPVAVDDTYRATAGLALVIAAPGVRANDPDVDGDVLGATAIDNPLHGTLALAADGSFTYTPADGYTGPDSFTYKLHDGTADSNVATVHLTVSASPTATGETYDTPEDTPLVIAAPGVLANDTDPETDPLTAHVVVGPLHGTLTLNTDGSFTYTPTANYNGPDSFTYKANDGTSDSNVAAVSLTVTPVSDAPVSVNDSFSTPEDSPLVIAAPGVLANDTDAENDPLTATVVVAPLHGTLTLATDGSFTYTPAANFNGADSFTYKANDGTADGNIATVNITVTPVHDAPIAVADAFNATAGQALNTAAPGVLSNDLNVDGGTLTVTKLTGPFNGTLTLNNNGSFVYTANAGFAGTDIFTYRITDTALATSDATVTFTVTLPAPANHAPTAGALTVQRNPGSSAIVNVHTAIADTDSDPLGVSVLIAPTHGRAFVNNNGTPANLADDFIEYLPSTDYFGTDTFTYEVSDGRGGTAHAKVTIKPRQFGTSPNPFDASKTDLVVLGTTGNDVIKLAKSGASGVKVVINGVNKGVFNPTGRVIADGLAGNDTITATGLPMAVQLYGGAGNDTLIASTKPSQLYGGDGNDTLQGGPAHDLLDGGSGKNVLTN